MNYRQADKAIAAMNLYFIREFRKVKSIMSFDELNVLSYSSELYGRLKDRATKELTKLAKEVYQENGGKKNAVTYEWMLEYVFDEFDPVLEYVFYHEIDRKQLRFAEAVIATKDPAKQAMTSLKQFSKMCAQKAIATTDKAALQAYSDSGYTMVKWITEKDDRVCAECRELDGKIFPINKIPAKPHWGCRCRYKPIK